ncbi:DNA adenine methylase [Sphingorhabdus sp. 109]|uniref:DNA adenine methylase n=1 Tax=Sphingorhabdus sp. 109 TaxID=2653173 RepID=UPI0012F3FF6D|nr:DNA adenine methylase [Sphingorhabdus sp. 109]VWX62622.1 DNA adenine methylase Dam [Sphingorhabdus sp. 109]
MNEEFKEFDPVRVVKPVAPYLGGKRALANRLVERFDAVPHKRYVEVFVGMGGPFFRRHQRPKMEVINDISVDVTNLFRILQRHYPQFLDTLRWQLAGRAEFDRLKASNPDVLTDLERAARFLYLQRMGFGGMPRSMGIDFNAGARFNLTKLEPMLQDVHERLSSVIIERMPFADLIRKYDSRPGTLFYCDPPYFGCEDDYGKNIFSEADFTVLRDLLASIQGRFVLSINAVPEIRELFADFDIEEVSLNYRVSGKVTPAKELIISN